MYLTEINRARKLAGMLPMSAELAEALDISGKVTLKPGTEDSVKDILGNAQIQAAINDHIADSPINLKGTGKACIFEHPNSGAELPGVLVANSGNVKYNTSDEAVDAANKAMANSGCLIYQFKSSLVIAKK